VQVCAVNGELSFARAAHIIGHKIANSYPGPRCVIPANLILW